MLWTRFTRLSVFFVFEEVGFGVVVLDFIGEMWGFLEDWRVGRWVKDGKGEKWDGVRLGGRDVFSGFDRENVNEDGDDDEDAILGD